MDKVKKVSEEAGLAKPKFLLIHLSYFPALQQPQFPSKVLQEHQSIGAGPQLSVGWLISVCQAASQPAAASKTLPSQVLPALTSGGMTRVLSAVF